MSLSFLTTSAGRSYTAGESQEFGLYTNLLGIPVSLFKEKSAGVYLKTLWGTENENLHFAGGISAQESRTRIFDLQGIKNSDKLC